MAGIEDFAAECRRVSMDLRRLPSALRRALAAEVKEKVAAPLAAEIASQAHGPWARILGAGVKARASADPQVVIGGLRPRVSGGAGPRQVIFGTEFGGGSNKRRTVTKAHTRKGRPVRAYSRYSTNQFTNHHNPFVFATIEAQLPEVLDTYADVVLEVFDREVGGNG